MTTHRLGAASASDAVDFRLSGDGATTAFATAETLLGSDINQDTDIYEWRLGALGLLTDGASDFPVEFTAPQVLGIDRDGSDILFALAPPGGGLTGFEDDELLNLYVARVGGGFPPPTSSPHCQEDDCQGPLVPAPSRKSPNSLTYEGKGNLKQGKKPCRAGKVRQQGRCTKPVSVITGHTETPPRPSTGGMPDEATPRTRTARSTPLVLMLGAAPPEPPRARFTTFRRSGETPTSRPAMKALTPPMVSSWCRAETSATRRALKKH